MTDDERRWEGPECWRSTSTDDLREAADDLRRLVDQGKADGELTRIYVDLWAEITRRSA